LYQLLVVSCLQSLDEQERWSGHLYNVKLQHVLKKMESRITWEFCPCLAAGARLLPKDPIFLRTDRLPL
jgi:hypothetical protein